MTLEEIRQKYPQYADLSDQVLADSLYESSYSDIERPEFDSLVGFQAKPDAPNASIIDTALDYGIDFSSGAVSLGESVVGIGDLLTGNLVGKGLSSIGYDPEKTREILKSGYSPERKQQLEEVQAAEGFLNTVIAAIQNPGVAIGTIIESTPYLLGSAALVRSAGTSMLASKGITPGTKAAQIFFKDPKVLTKLATIGAISEGAMAAGSIQEQARQEGQGYFDSAGYALAAGAGTALIGRLASRIPGFGDLETTVGTAGLGAGEGFTTGRLKQAIMDIGKGAIQEGVLEELPQSAQEQVFSNLALDKPWNENVPEAAAMGLIAGAGMGGGVGIIRTAMRRKDIEETIAGITDPDKSIDDAISEADQILQGNEVEFNAAIESSAIESQAKERSDIIQDIQNQIAEADKKIEKARGDRSQSDIDTATTERQGLRSELSNMIGMDLDTTFNPTVSNMEATLIPGEQIPGIDIVRQALGLEIETDQQSQARLDGTLGNVDFTPTANTDLSIAPRETAEDTGGIDFERPEITTSRLEPSANIQTSPIESVDFKTTDLAIETNDQANSRLSSNNTTVDFQPSKTSSMELAPKTAPTTGSIDFVRPERTTSQLDGAETQRPGEQIPSVDFERPTALSTTDIPATNQDATTSAPAVDYNPDRLPLVKSDGTAFKTEKSATMSKQFKSVPGATVIPVDGGFAVKPPTAEQVQATKDQAAEADKASTELSTKIRGIVGRSEKLSDARTAVARELGNEVTQQQEQNIKSYWNQDQQKARKQIKESDSLAVAIAKLGGIDMSYREDMTRDTTENKMVPGVGAMFNKKGTSPDDMATALLQYNYLTQSEIDNAMDNGGVNALADLINEELAGGKKRYQVGSAFEQEQMNAEIDAEYLEQKQIVEEDRDDVYSEIAAEYGQEIADQARVYDQDTEDYVYTLESDLDSQMESQIQQERDLENETINQDAAEASTTTSDESIGQTADQQSGFARTEDQNAQEEDFQLGQQSDADILAQERAQKAADDTAKKAEEKQKADDELGDFNLAGSNSAVDQAESRGQGNMFDAMGRAPVSDTEAEVQRLTKQVNKGEGTDQLRAKAGGEFGPNGEWYEGGKFIATTNLPKRMQVWLKNATRNTEVLTEFATDDTPAKKSIPRIGQFPIVSGIADAYGAFGPQGKTSDGREEWMRENYSPDLYAEIVKARDLYISGDRWVSVLDFPLSANVSDLSRMIVNDIAVPEEAIINRDQKVQDNIRAVQKAYENEFSDIVTTPAETSSAELVDADIFEAIDNAADYNKKLENSYVERNFSDQISAEFLKIRTRTKRNEWLDDNLTGDQENELQDLYNLDEDRLNELSQYVGQFDDSSPQAMGKSIALWFKDVDSKNFKDTPQYAGILSALEFAKSKNWDLNTVMVGATDRINEWAGSDAAELFPRFFGQDADNTRTIEQVQLEYQAVEVLNGDDMTESRLEQQDTLREEAKDLQVEKAQSMLDEGKVPVFQEGDLYYTITPSTRSQGKYQLTTYNKTGALGDTTLNSLEAINRELQLASATILPESEADKVMGDIAIAEGEFQERRTKSQEQANDPASQAISQFTTAIKDLTDQLKAPAATGQATQTVAEPDVKSTPLSQADEQVSKIPDGDLPIDEFKAAFEFVVENKEAIKTELSSSMTKAQLLDRLGAYESSRYKNEKKSMVVSTVFDDILSDFLAPTAGESGMISYSIGMGGDATQSKRNKINALTQEDLDNHATRIEQSRKDRAKALEEKEEGIENPESIQDYENLLNKLARENEVKTFAEARNLLPLDQRMEFDVLKAAESRGKRVDNKDAEKTRLQTSDIAQVGEIIETTHTKKGYDLFVIQLEDRIEKEEYQKLNASAKKLGGRYSSFRGSGAIPGFTFTERDNAEAFQKLVGGDTDQAQEVAQARRDEFKDDKSQSAVERLRTMADSLEERANTSLNQDRKENTARRAGMAASATAKAEAEIAMAQTMNNIANSIESGDAQFLDQVRTKTQVEMLDSFIHIAKSEQAYEMFPGDYTKQQNFKYSEPTAETAEKAVFPAYVAWRSDLAKLGRQLQEIPGTKRMGDNLIKVADDVSSQYTKWAKDNLIEASVFKKADGSLAAFSTKKAALASIYVSGFSGQAIPFQVKRGEHVIVLSPSEAQKRGIWEGQEDKKISLSKDFSSELITKLNRKSVDVPWILDSAHAKRKRLSAMNIETPAEFRSMMQEYIASKSQAKEPNKIKELERAMVGRRNDGLDFFPTPALVAGEMIDAAGIEEGMTVLEPSAGMGHIADQVRQAGFEPDVVEISGDRRELLEAKGYNVIDTDFLETTDKYDRIIMNPPFSDRRDFEHVQHAYSLLNENGRLVAIVGEGVFFGSDKKAKEFRDWFESTGGTDEKLAEGTFQDPSLPVTTGVNARMIVIDKSSDEDVLFSDDDILQISKLQADPDVRGLKVEKIRGSLAPALANLNQIDGFDVEILQSVGDLPPGALNQTDKNGRYKGAFYQGKVYLFADNLNSRRDAETTLAHELVGHKGVLVGATAEEWSGIKKDINNLLKLKNATAVDIASETNRRYKNLKQGSENWNKEFLAIAAERRSLRGTLKDMVERVKAIVRRYMKELGFKGPFAESDIESILQNSEQNLRNRRGDPRANPNDSFLGVSDLPMDTESRLQRARDMGFDTDTVYYHKSKNDFEEFSRDAESGWTIDKKTNGIYFASDRDYVNMYSGTTVYPTYLKKGARIKDVSSNLELSDQHKETRKAEQDGFTAVRITDNSLGEFIVFDPSQIRSVNAEFDPDFSDSGNILMSQEEPDSALKEIADRVLAKTNRGSFANTLKQSIEDHKDNWQSTMRRGLVDEYQSIADLETAQYGELRDATDSAYKAATFSKKSGTVLDSVMTYGAPVYKDGGIEIDESMPGLVKIFEPLAMRGMVREWELWAGAVRAKRLMAEGRENLYTQKDIDTILGSVTGKKLELYQKIQRNWTAFNKRMLDFSEAAGLINPEERQLWESDDYVPFHRISELPTDNPKNKSGNTKGLAGKKSGITQLKGGVEQISIMESIVRNTTSMIDASMKNIAMQRTIELAEKTGVVEEVSDATISDEEAIKRLDDYGIQYTDKNLGAYKSLLAKNDARNGTVSVSVNGKPKRYLVNDPVLLRAMNGLGPTGIEGVMKIFRMPKMLLTELIVADPSFSLRNFTRDTLSTWVTVNGIKRNPISDAVKNVRNAYNETDTLKSMRIQGVGGGSFYDVTPEGVRSHLEKVSGDASIGTSVAEFWQSYKKVLGTTELANRMAVYDAVIKAGGSKAEAAYQADDVLNFTRHGEWKAINFLIQSVPFMNSRIQGLDRLARGAKEGTTKAHQFNQQFMMKGAVYTAATLALLAANWDNEDYWDLEEWERDTYYHFYTPGGGHFRMPKPFEVGAIFSTVPERLFEQFREDANMKLLGKRMLSMFANTFAFDPVPQIFKPAYEVAKNESSFTKRQILSQGMKYASPEAQYTPYTSKTFIELADAMPDSAPEWMRSPARLEHLYRGYLGTLGGYVLLGSDFIARQATGAPPRPEARIRDIPVLNSFIRDGVQSNKQLGKIYDLSNDINEIYTAMNKYRKEGASQKAISLLTNNKEKLRLRIALNKTTTQMGNIGAQIRKAYDSKTLNPAEKRKMIDDLTTRRNAIAKNAEKRFRDFF